jgi:hypothetical protein
MPPSNPPPNQNNDTRVRSRRPIRRGSSDSKPDNQDKLRLMDENMARGAFSRRPNWANEGEIEMGLDPNTMLPFYGSKKDGWLDLKAGALDALYGTAAMGAGMLGMVPSPSKEKFETQQGILKNRQDILRQYMAFSNNEKVSPGSVISKAADISGDLLNPAGKFKYLNALWHALRAAAGEKKVSDAFIAAGSNLAGEAIEDSATGILKKKFPAAAAYLSKLPFFKKLAGLPGNVVGGTVLEPAANSAVEYLTSFAKKPANMLHGDVSPATEPINILDEYISNKTKNQNLSEYEIRELRERMMRRLGQGD